MARINIQIEGMSIEEADVVMKALTQAVGDAPTETAAAVAQAQPKVDALVEQGRQQAAAEQEDDLPGDLGHKGNGPEPTAEAKPKGSKNKATAKAAKDAKNDQTNVVDLAEKREAGSLIEKVSKFTKLVDVISVLREEGEFADDDALISECERIQEQVPALKKISDVSGRVKRVLERLSA